MVRSRTQAIRNLQANRPAGTDIKDYDLFYFDDQDLSESGEKAAQAHADSVLSDLGITVEVANQARVHLWYPQHFGRPCPPLTSSEDGIRRFLSFVVSRARWFCYSVLCIPLNPASLPPPTAPPTDASPSSH
ncbi:nucleotidyltransferase-like protein [Paracidovorax citrulli]|nr:nucleotidyltransferase-like protein [Paracidovorax citrulli]